MNIAQVIIHDVKDDLPEPGESVFAFGIEAGMNPQMGGSYWFKTYRVYKEDFNRSGLLSAKRNFDDNQFYASYVTHWCQLPKVLI